MYIFYTHDYRNEKGESHRLLTEAIAAYLDIGQDSDDSSEIQTAARNMYIWRKDSQRCL